MKNKMLIFITSLVIFAAAFYLNVASSYAFESSYNGYPLVGYIENSSNSKFLIYTNGEISFNYVRSVNGIKVYQVKSSSASYGGWVGSSFSYYTDVVFPNFDYTYYNYVPYDPSSYDPVIGSDLEAWTVLDFDANFLTNSILHCGCFFRSSDCDHVDIFVSGSKKTETFSVTGNYGAQWFSMTDYADPGDTVTICFTPYDSSGNWGNTSVINQPVYTSIVQGLYQFFTGYTNKVTNSSGTTDIIGIQDPTVVTVQDKPTNTSPPPVVNPIKTTTVYVPVFQGDSSSIVINQYVNNNNVVNNTYNDTYNTINLTTNIEVNFDIDVNTVTENVNNIKTDLEDYSGIWVNLLNLFDMFFPFLNGVGAVGVGLFISIIGLILVSIPVRILFHFLN